MKKSLVTSLLVLAAILSSCSSAQNENLIATKADIVKSSPTPTPRPQKTATPTMTLDPTQAATATLLAQFPAVCENYWPSSLSPNMEWFAMSCGYHNNPRMVVTSKTGITWELQPSDILPPEDPGLDGYLAPEHWNLDYNLLYFKTNVNWDGGGSQCFMYGTGTGLYGLNLQSGNWYPIVPAEYDFPGYFFDFSPTDEYVFLNKDGATLVNLLTNESTIINAYPTYSFEWNSDGSKLAYSVGTCSGDTGLAETSAVFVYTLQTGESKKLLSVDDMLLRVGDWQDADHIEIYSQKDVSDFYSGVYTSTHFLYDITKDEYGIVTSTPTPTP